MADRIIADLGASGTWTVAVAITQPLFSPPIPGVNTDYLLRQDFVVLKENYASLALNEPHDDFPDFLLVEEGTREDFGCGAVKWTRTYAKVPAAHVEVQTDGYLFIGFTGSIINNNITTTVNEGRWRFHRVVNHKVLYEYFLVDGTTIADPTAVPIIHLTRYTSHDPDVDIDFLWDDVGHGGVQTFPSIPSLTDYRGLIAADAASTSSFSLVAKDSVLDRWYGNIWRRITLYVKAI